MFHRILQQRFHFFPLVSRHFQDELVVNLHEKAASQAAAFQFVLNGVHGQLDDIGGAALDRRVHRRPLGKGTARKVLAVNICQRADASEHGLGHPRFAGFRHELVHVSVNRAVAGEIGIDIFLGLLTGNRNIAGQSEVADAINNAEIDGFGMGALLRRDLVPGNAEDFRRRPAMDVLIFLEAVDHRRVLRQMSQKAQLDLRVVAGYDVVVSFARHE